MRSPGMRSGSAFERGNRGFEKLLVGKGGSSKLQESIYYSLMLKIEEIICTYVQKNVVGGARIRVVAVENVEVKANRPRLFGRSPLL